MTKKYDAIVLGAGIVGVSAALHLQARGRSVALIDRKKPGSETSHGNAGLIERASVIPYGFPRDPRSLLGFASNRSSSVRYRPAYLLRSLPWLARYWWWSEPSRLRSIALEMLPLIERSVIEHDHLNGPAGVTDLFRAEGWIEFYRSQGAFDGALKSSSQLTEFNLSYDVLDERGLKQREPEMLGEIAGAFHWLDPKTVSDPGRVTQAYAELFVARGGDLLTGDAKTLLQDGAEWALAGGVRARDVVIALGPWSHEICARLGYRVPMAFKCGYHMHYAMAEGRVLRHPLCDAEAGVVITPMTRGVRLTTGIELAHRDAAPNGAQLRMAEAKARKFFPFGAAVDPTPWRGARPAMPDMKPVIGRALRHGGLWFDFGHTHHGFTLGPASGRLLAEMMTGEQTFADPRPFALERFE